LSIPAHAFESCGALEEMALPASVESVGSLAFHHCFRPLRVSFPADSALKRLEWDTFGGCSSHMVVSIPASIEKRLGGFLLHCRRRSVVTSKGVRYLEVLWEDEPDDDDGWEGNTEQAASC
jgi:hypothetical protein